MVKVVRVPISKDAQYRLKPGMHLYNPSPFKLDQARDDAYANGFKTIYVHTAHTEGPLIPEW